MKRCHKIILSLLLILCLWLWSFSQLDLVSGLAIPLVAAVLLAAYAAWDILGSIINIKNYPEERTSLNEDIRRASAYYKSVNKPYL